MWLDSRIEKPRGSKYYFWHSRLMEVFRFERRFNIKECLRNSQENQLYQRRVISL